MPGGTSDDRCRCADQQSRPPESRDCTNVTLAEFQTLVPPFEAVFRVEADAATAITPLAEDPAPVAAVLGT